MVATVNGAAEVKAAAGDWRALGKGMAVGIGHSLRTGGDGRILLARGDERVTISPNSRFQMVAPDRGMATKILQELGTLLFKVHKRPEQHFEVTTPYLIATVKGTTFTVSVDRTGGAVHVVEGLVEVATPAGLDRMMVHPGRTATVAAKQGSKIQLGAPPQQNKRDVPGKQSEAPTIKRTIAAEPIDIEEASRGLFTAEAQPRAKQTASREKDSKQRDGNSDSDNGASAEKRAEKSLDEGNSSKAKKDLDKEKGKGTDKIKVADTPAGGLSGSGISPSGGGFSSAAGTGPGAGTGNDVEIGNSNSLSGDSLGGSISHGMGLAKGHYKGHGNGHGNGHGKK
jgi:hypothetical protein